RTFWVSCPISTEFRVDQSVAHNGVCLTVEEIKNNFHRLTAIEETLAKTDLNSWAKGTSVNIERCLQMNGRIDGHIVQGHVDTTATCIAAITKDGSWEYTFKLDEKFASLIIEKGSITVNGISLTIFNVTRNTFSVGIIPYTYLHTNMQFLQQGNTVNIEFDIIGKYVNRIAQLK
ncbi:MAG: riboflavin synthase, partial [Sphingobacteriales bacterium]|nr:riboflavin synthase [Sphingobacteriales bacterium]